jgi:hypothetical protein
MAFEPRVIGKTEGLNDEVIKKLDIIAKKTGKDVKIISGVDTRKYLKDSNKGKSKLTAHECKIAADVQIEGMNSEQIATELENAGFSGVGRYYFKDGTPTHTAHGDLRGLPVAKGTKFEKGLEKKYKWGYKWYYLEGKHYGKSIDWLPLDGPPHPKPAKVKPAEIKPAPPAEKPKPTVKMNRAMLIAAIIAALVIIAVLVAISISPQSGTPAGDLVGTWRTSSPVTFHTQTDFDYPFTLHDVESEKRDITWIITAGTSDGTFDIEEHYTSSDKSSTGTYTPEFSPNFYTGVINGDRLTVQKGDSIVGEFNFTSSIITGTWDDSTWSSIYTQRTYTASNGLTLTKQ